MTTKSNTRDRTASNAKLRRSAAQSGPKADISEAELIHRIKLYTAKLSAVRNGQTSYLRYDTGRPAKALKGLSAKTGEATLVERLTAAVGTLERKYGVIVDDDSLANTYRPIA